MKLSLWIGGYYFTTGGWLVCMVESSMVGLWGKKIKRGKCLISKSQ